MLRVQKFRKVRVKKKIEGFDELKNIEHKEENAKEEVNEPLEKEVKTYKEEEVKKIASEIANKIIRGLMKE